jgi:Xaa-Pro aminopeptidase
MHPDTTRLQRLCQHASPGLDGYFITHPPNIRYLCGFTGSSGVLLAAGGENVFFTDGRYTTQAGEEVRGARVVVESKGPLAAAVEWLQRRRGAVTLGIEGEHLSLAAHAHLRKLLPTRVRLRNTPGAVERLRLIKDATEIERIRAAVQLGSSLLAPAVRRIAPGVREVEVAAVLELAARRGGAEGMSFSTIVAAGQRSALPHGVASAAPIPRRGFVVLDFGVILAGYCSDMTRTVHVGRPSAAARARYQAVLEAQQAAAAAVGPGRGAHEVDAAARKVLTKRGLGKYFAHSTGHGVGLEIHEAPRLARGSKDILEPGMVITIEPGVYVPGEGGVRIEDMVLVTAKGSEVLTPTPKELIVI